MTHTRVPTSHSHDMDAVHDEITRLPQLSRALVAVAFVVAFALNPLFAFDDAVAFCPRDVLFRAQFHRVFAHALHVDGPLSGVALAVAAARIVAPFERERGTLRCAWDGCVAVALANGTACVIAVLLGGVFPRILAENYLFGTGAFEGMFVVFARECARTPTNVLTFPAIGATIPARRAPFIFGLAAMFLGGNALELVSCVYVGHAWGSGLGFTWATASDGYLADLENAPQNRWLLGTNYVAVNGQTLPVSREGASGTSTGAFTDGFLAAVSNFVREVQGRVSAAFARFRREDAESLDEPSTASAPPEASATADTRPKPTTREERAAAFAAAFDRRRDGDGASPT